MPRTHFRPQIDLPTDERRQLRSLVGSSDPYEGSRSNYLRARADQIKEETAHNRFQIQQENLELTRMKAVAELMKAKAAVQQQMQQQEHTVRALETIGKLDPKSPDYNIKVAEVFHENPLAARDKLVQEIVHSQIQSRHVMETTDAAIKQHEESQGSEFSRIHGIDVVRNKEGRIDWTASSKAAEEASKQRQAAAVAGIDPSLKPSESKITDGKVTDIFKAPAADKPLPPTTITTTETPSPIPGGAPSVRKTTTIHTPAGAPAPSATGPVSIGGVTVGTNDGRPPLSDIFR